LREAISPQKNNLQIMSKKIALIDGYGFVFRAYHSLPPLTRSDGTPTNAVYGFTNMLIKLLAGLDVTHVAAVFDSGSKTFRNDIYEAYKANRPPCPEDLKPQFPLIRQSAEALNLAILEKVGFEADDIIATIAKKYADENHQVLIVSSDKDLMQLVDDNILMYDAMKNKIIGAKEVKEKFFVEPKKVLDVLSLIGDSSDNIPGVKGIGPKTAAELIEQFGTLENIFENLDQIKQEKRRQMLFDGKENAKLSKKLADLHYNVDTQTSLEDLEIKAIDPHKLISFLEEQGFRSLVTKVKNEFNLSNYKPAKESSNQELSKNKSEKKTSFKEIKIHEISSLENIEEFNQKAVLNGIVTIDCEENFVTISTNKFGEKATEVFYFEAALDSENKEKTEATDLFNFEENSIPQEEKFSLKILDPILQNDSIKKIFFNAKKFLKLAKINSYEDVLLINHLLNSSIKNNLRELIDLNLNENCEELGFGEIFAELDKNKQPEIFKDTSKKVEFFAFKNFAISELYQIFHREIFSKNLNQAYYSFELPLLEVLAQIETSGIKIDVEKLKNLSAEFGKKINQLSSEIYSLAGCEFNIASPKQLGEVLFEKLGLDSGKKSKKTGALSTSSSVLEELEESGHEIARKILDFRKFSKLKNTYTDSLPKEINPKTSRVHTTLSTTGTITGRLSSSNPNLQNIPIKSAEGQKIRESFISEKNHVLISADYSQIELRVIAEVAKIENLVKAFRENKDIHRITASQVFGIPENEVSDDLRSKAKAINFGIIYGISAFGLAKQLDISRQDAATYIKSYLEAYPGIDSYMKNYINLARQNGFVETISGRKCFIHEINNKNPMIRNEAERLSINAPIQGSAADIIKKAMIKIGKKLIAENLQSRIILQIHDELIVEAPENEIEIATKILKNEMENAVALEVPLRVDVKVGKNWL
jgi:DNA polymerase I